LASKIEDNGKANPFAAFFTNTAIMSKYHYLMALSQNPCLPW